MATQGRFFRPRDASLKGLPYDSLLEKRLHETHLQGANHHPEPIPYTWEHTYEPDFVLGNILVECKGYFQDRADCTKYIWVKRALPPEKELVFVFEDPNKPIHFQAKRTNGSRMRHFEWAEKHGFRWFSEQTIGDILHEQNPSNS